MENMVSIRLDDYNDILCKAAERDTLVRLAQSQQYLSCKLVMDVCGIDYYEEEE